jgi:hypothetical protein
VRSTGVSACTPAWFLGAVKLEQHEPLGSSTAHALLLLSRCVAGTGEHSAAWGRGVALIALDSVLAASGVHREGASN